MARSDEDLRRRARAKRARLARARGADLNFARTKRSSRFTKAPPVAPGSSFLDQHRAFADRVLESRIEPMRYEPFGTTYKRRAKGRNHTHGPGPRRCPKCGV